MQLNGATSAFCTQLIWSLCLAFKTCSEHVDLEVTVKYNLMHLFEKVQAGSMLHIMYSNSTSKV